MKTVLFACVHNAGRSQMAAATFNSLADPAKAHAISAGTEPGVHAHPEVIEVMSEVGVDLRNVVPRKLTEDLAAEVNMLVTMGCGEACPVLPGIERDDWALEDPKAKPLERVRAIRDEIHARVTTLLEAKDWKKAEVFAMHIAPASLRDLATIAALLDDLDLPTDGIADQFPDAYVTAIEQGGIVGCAGLETYGRVGLLRSVAVNRAHRKQGVGRLLVANRIAAAKAKGLEAVYLLTTTAVDYFPRLGFVPIDRRDIPESLASAPELASVCPASAVCLRLHLAASATGPSDPIDDPSSET